MVRFVLASLLATLFLSPVTSFAGCNKTVMGGGCSMDAEAGVAAHMRTQPKASVAVEKKVAVANPKAAAALNAVKVSNVPNQKPQI